MILMQTSHARFVFCLQNAFTPEKSPNRGHSSVWASSGFNMYACHYEAQRLSWPFCVQEIYTYAYSFSCEKGQKCLQLDVALAMWQLIFAERPWPLLEHWCTFLQDNHKRAISRDTWVQLLEFIQVSLSCVSSYCAALNRLLCRTFS